jgi:aspartate aminotransferase-like enzyme
LTSDVHFLTELPDEKYTTILMQGSGTFAVESVLQSTSDRSKKVNKKYLIPY